MKLASEVDGVNDHGKPGWFDKLAKDVSAHSIFANWVLKVRPTPRHNPHKILSE